MNVQFSRPLLILLFPIFVGGEIQIYSWGIDIHSLLAPAANDLWDRTYQILTGGVLASIFTWAVVSYPLHSIYRRATPWVAALLCTPIFIATLPALAHRSDGPINLLLIAVVNSMTFPLCACLSLWFVSWRASRSNPAVHTDSAPAALRR